MNKKNEKFERGMKKDQALKLLISLMSLALAIILVLGLVISSCAPDQGGSTTPTYIVTIPTDDTEPSTGETEGTVSADGVPDWTDPTEQTVESTTEPTGNTGNTGGDGQEDDPKPTTGSNTEPTTPEQTVPPTTVPIIGETEPSADATFSFDDLFN